MLLFLKILHLCYLPEVCLQLILFYFMNMRLPCNFGQLSVNCISTSSKEELYILHGFLELVSITVG